MNRFNIFENGITKVSLSIRNHESAMKLKKFLEELSDVQINKFESKQIWVPVTFDDVYQTILNKFINIAHQRRQNLKEVVIRYSNCDSTGYKIYFSDDAEEDLQSLNIEYMNFDKEELMLFKIFKRISKYQIKLYKSDLYAEPEEKTNVLNTRLFKVEKVFHKKKLENETFDETIERVIRQASSDEILSDSFTMVMGDRLACAIDLMDFDQ